MSSISSASSRTSSRTCERSRSAAGSQVDDATGGSDDHVHARAECIDLRLVGAAAVDGQHADAEFLASLLRGRWPPGRANSRVGHTMRACGLPDGICRQVRVSIRCRGGDALEQGDAETEGLAGAGLGLPDHVAAFEREPEAHLLDREGGDDAVFGEGLDDRVRDAERGECRSRPRVIGASGGFLWGFFGYCSVACGAQGNSQVSEAH